MSDTPSLALPLLAAGQAQKHVTHNEALHLLDAIVQLSVKDRDLTAPPGAPAEGDRYVVAAGPSGAWAGQATRIAVWQGGAWNFRIPREGWRVWVDDENALLIFDGAAWVDVGSAIKVLQNLTLLGIGTAADATNPFSAKLNKALWTAKTAAEGGDGDLRYTMSKEAAADVLSLLLQTGFSGRAEVGLIGDDDLTVKVSPDGSAWTTALVIDKTSGAARFVAGSVSAPGVEVGDANIGLFQTAGKLHTAIDGAEAARHTATGLALNIGGAAFDPADPLDIRRPGGSNAFASISGESGVGWRAKRYSDNAAAPTNRFDKYRGTIAAPAAVLQDDVLGQFTFFGYAGSAERNGGFLQWIARAATPSATDMETQEVLSLTPAGSTAASEIRRFDHATGFSMFGANVVIDQNRNFRRRVYTIATLPASVSGLEVQVSDLGGGAGPLIGDGTGWLHDGQGGQADVATDAAFTLTPLSSAPNIRHTGTLTVGRLVTLSTTNARPGSWFLITRTGAGAFDLDVGGLKNLGQNSWCKVVFDGTAWYLAAYGTL